MPNRRRSLPTSHLARTLVAAVCTTVIAGALGVGLAFAETRTGLYVSNAGNVGIASTVGYVDQQQNYHADGSSVSTWSNSMYFVGATLRVWHFGGLYINAPASCNYCTGTTTGYKVWNVGESAATQSSFIAINGGLANAYYTSYPDYSDSCYAYWSGSSSHC